jgi:hypothetical protein
LFRMTECGLVHQQQQQQQQQMWQRTIHAAAMPRLCSSSCFSCFTILLRPPLVFDFKSRRVLAVWLLKV